MNESERSDERTRRKNEAAYEAMNLSPSSHMQLAFAHALLMIFTEESWIL